MRFNQTGLRVANWARALSWWKWLLTIDFVFVFVTFTSVKQFLPDSWWKLYHHFDLGRELNLAAWWSAVSLFCLGLLAYECYSTTEYKKMRFARIILAIILFGLSLDEIGSLHERVGDWSRIIIVIALGALIFSISLFVLITNRKTRKSAILITIMFTLFGSVALQEAMEHAVHWPVWAQGIRAGVEEGTELCAFLLGFWALAQQREVINIRLKSLAVIPDPFLFKNLRVLLIGGLFVHLLFSYLASTYPDLGYRGNPAVWYPMAVSFLLMCACVYRFLFISKERQFIWLVLAAYFAFSSLTSVYLISPRIGSSLLAMVPSAPNFNRLYAAQFIFIALVFTWVNRHRRLHGFEIFLLVLLAIILCTSFIIDNLLYRFIISGIFVFVIGNLFLIHEKQAMATESETERIQSLAVLR